MTSISSPPTAALSRHRYTFSPARVALLGFFLACLAVIELYLYHTAFNVYQTYLLEEQKKSTAWIVGQLSYMLPFLTVCLFQYIVYHKHNAEDGIPQREMAWEVAVMALLIYAIALPVTAHISQASYDAAVLAGETIEKTTAGVEKTLLMAVADWYIRLSIPLGLLMVYHGSRAKRERAEVRPE